MTRHSGPNGSSSFIQKSNDQEVVIHLTRPATKPSILILEGVLSHTNPNGQCSVVRHTRLITYAVKPGLLVLRGVMSLAKTKQSIFEFALQDTWCGLTGFSTSSENGVCLKQNRKVKMLWPTLLNHLSTYSLFSKRVMPCEFRTVRVLRFTPQNFNSKFSPLVWFIYLGQK